jgi:hypothetical protein
MMMNRRNFSAAESIDLVAGTSAWPLTTSSRNLSPVASPQGSPATEIFCEPWRLLRSAVRICRTPRLSKLLCQLCCLLLPLVDHV